MKTSHALKRAISAAIVAVAALVLLFPAVADAHSLGSSTIAVRITDSEVEATISVALETLDEALGTDYVNRSDFETYSNDIIDYLDEHLTVTGDGGTVWIETFTDPTRESVEGIESFSVEVAFDTGSSALTRFAVEYDGVIDAIDTHEAVVVLTDSNNDISTVGVITADDTSLTITDGSHQVPVGDMIGYGFDHVLEGADHLLFLATLLLPAPLIVAGRRWRPGPGPWATARKVIHVVTAFTIGHSITLIASALGWVTPASRPVEILIAVSVGVSAIHAMRPLARHGEEAIALGFGLVHGLAFAGILSDLGLEGTTSLLTLLAFNIGIELSQLATTALVFPSLYLLSQTRLYPAVRIGGASLALAAAAGWALDRLEILTNPFAKFEDTAIAHPWRVVLAVAAIAALATGIEKTLQRREPPSGDNHPAADPPLINEPIAATVAPTPPLESPLTCP